MLPPFQLNEATVGRPAAADFLLFQWWRARRFRQSDLPAWVDPSSSLTGASRCDAIVIVDMLVPVASMPSSWQAVDTASRRWCFWYPFVTGTSLLFQRKRIRFVSNRMRVRSVVLNKLSNRVREIRVVFVVSGNPNENARRVQVHEAVQFPQPFWLHWI